MHVRVSVLDGLPLSKSKVESYFSSFGEFQWCRQSDDKLSVEFAFADPSIYSMVLDFNHHIERRSLLVTLVESEQGDAGGSVPSSSSSKGGAAPCSASLPIDNGHSGAPHDPVSQVPLSTPEDLARYIEQLANSVQS